MGSSRGYSWASPSGVVESPQAISRRSDQQAISIDLFPWVAPTATHGSPLRGGLRLHSPFRASIFFCQIPWVPAVAIHGPPLRGTSNRRRRAPWVAAGATCGLGKKETRSTLMGSHKLLQQCQHTPKSSITLYSQPKIARWFSKSKSEMTCTGTSGALFNV
jgi:hypothetical protein